MAVHRCVAALALCLLVAPPAAAQGLSALVGQWIARSADGETAFRIDPEGNCAVDQIQGICHVSASTVTMRNAQGALTYTYRVDGRTLTFTGGDLDRPVTFQRIAGPPPAAPAPQRQAAPPFSPPPAQPPVFAPAGQQHPVVGRWTGPRGELVVATDGTLSLNGEPPSRWQVQGGNLVVENSEGLLFVPFTVRGNTLTTLVNGEQLNFQRVAGAVPQTARGARPPFGGIGGGGHAGSGQELVGTWCYMANVNAIGGGRMSQRCFTLHPNGTYTYNAESSTSTAFGGTASRASDSGTWQLRGGTLHANSRNEGPLQYQLVKRNHPRTGDPMLCLDGDCYVTATQRRPW